MYPSERERTTERKRTTYVYTCRVRERECVCVLERLYVREIGADLLRQRHVRTQEQ